MRCVNGSDGIPNSCNIGVTFNNFSVISVWSVILSHDENLPIYQVPHLLGSFDTGPAFLVFCTLGSCSMLSEI